MSIISRVFKPGSYDPSVGAGSGTMSEWFPSYASRYPQNNVLASTQSGHLIELDDTPGAERVHLYHRSGSHIEMRPDGSVKYKTVNARQDVTIGDHEIIIQGDYRITTDGGMQLNVRNGKLIIEAGAGVEVNATGGDITLKAQKGNINLDAQKISLNSLYVDIGKGSPPYLSLPAGINSLFGVPIPMISLKVPKFNMALLGIFGVVAEIGFFVERALSLTKRMAYFKTILDPASGDPQIPEIDQPEEIPLSSPGLYRDTSPGAARLRDRQLDTPEDVGNTETYSAHLSINAEMGDYDQYPDAKKLPGQIFNSDEAIPAEAPLPYRSFEVGHGKISCELDSPNATGTSTKFTEELVVGQRVVVAGQVMIVGSIIDDTSLLWQENWPIASVSNKTIFAAQLRPFREFFHRYNYNAEFPLGDSGLVLKNMMVNFVAPVIDKPTTPFYGETTGGGGTYEPNADGNRPDLRPPERPPDSQKTDPQSPTTYAQ